MWRFSHLIYSQMLLMHHRFFITDKCIPVSPSAAELRVGLSGFNTLTQAGLSMNTLHRIESGHFWNVSSEGDSPASLCNLFLCLVAGQESSSQIR